MSFQKNARVMIRNFFAKKSDQEIRQIINRTMHPVSVPVHFCLSLLRASPRVCQILFGKSCDLPTHKNICQVKKTVLLQQFSILDLAKRKKTHSHMEPYTFHKTSKPRSKSFPDLHASGTWEKRNCIFISQCCSMVRSVLRQAPWPAGLGHAGTHSLEHACTRRSVRQARRPAGLGHAGTHRSLEHACTRCSLGRGLRHRVDARRTPARIFAR